MDPVIFCRTWWRHQIETFSALLALCGGNSPVSGEVPSQRPVTRSSDFYLRLNKRLSKQSWGWWFDTPLRSLWRHCNVPIQHGKSNADDDTNTSAWYLTKSRLCSVCFVIPCWIVFQLSLKRKCRHIDDIFLTDYIERCPLTLSVETTNIRNVKMMVCLFQ